MVSEATQAKREEFARLYVAGAKWTAIAAILGTQKGTLIRWRAQLGLKTHNATRDEALNPKRAEFERLYRTTPLGAKAIAKKLGMAKTTAGRIRRSLCLPAKPAANSHLSRGPRQPRARDHLREFACAWWSECQREQKAVAKIDACWGRPRPKTYREDISASRAYGAAAARRRHARLKHTPEWKIRAAARNAIARICRMVGSRRKARTRTFEFLGCDYAFARAYLNARLKPGQTWENHGVVWEIDHIIPLAAFDLTKERERKKALHFTNLQPLFKHENRAKSAKIARQEMLAI